MHHRFGKTKPKSCEILVFGKTKPKSREISVPGMTDYPLHGSASGGYRSRMTGFDGTGFS
jgi:hypothetical protein